MAVADLILESVPLARGCEIVLHRTLRIPDDGGDYPLPPSLGALPVLAVGDDEFVAPLRRAEAMWLGFNAPYWKPRALKVGIGGIDAISGDPFEAGSLSKKPQDYVVIPDQPWLDGINAGDGFPWFDLLAPTKTDIAAAERLASVRSVADLEGRHEAPLAIPEGQVRRLLQLRAAVDKQAT